MGVVRQGHALSEDLGPGFGRGMGMTTQEKNVSNAIGAPVPAQTGVIYTCPMHPEVKSDKEGKCPKCGMTLVKIQVSGVELTEAEKKKVPGYPQDMMMIMDDDVAKPETSGLARGWTASMMGMMTLVRVLPPDKYEKIMGIIKEGKKPEPTDHKHHQSAVPADAIKVSVSSDGFSPARIEVKAGQPLKLAFYRADAENCGDTVVFPKLKIEAKLPAGKTTIVEVVPKEKGELVFTCGMGMFKGSLFVQ